MKTHDTPTENQEKGVEIKYDQKVYDMIDDIMARLGSYCLATDLVNVYGNKLILAYTDNDVVSALMRYVVKRHIAQKDHQEEVEESPFWIFLTEECSISRIFEPVYRMCRAKDESLLTGEVHEGTEISVSIDRIPRFYELVKTLFPHRSQF